MSNPSCNPPNHNKIYTIIAISILCSLCASPALAQSDRHLEEVRTDSALSAHKLIFFGKGEEPHRDSTLMLIQRFYEDQFRHFQDPLAPYFLFLSKDSKLAMGIGGCVRMRGYFDWGGALPSPGFAPYLIPMEKDPLRKRHLGTTPAGTALFFRVIGRNKFFGEYQVYIEANFNGYEARDFHLKKAYASINDWTFGYTDSSFSDPTALPPTVDASGPNAKISATSVLIRWLHKLPKGFTVAASVETPSDRIETVPDQTAPVSQYIPDVAAFLQYNWDDSSYTRFSAIYRSLPYRNLIAGKNHNKSGYGLQVTTMFRPLRAITVYGCMNGGKGYGSLGGDWLMGSYDLVSNPDKPGELYAPLCYGGYIGLQYNFTPMIFASTTFGGTKYSPTHNVAPDQFKQGLYMAANLFWYFTPRISCAVEFNLGRRLNFSGETAWARRLGTFVSFSF